MSMFVENKCTAFFRIDTMVNVRVFALCHAYNPVPLRGRQRYTLANTFKLGFIDF